MPNRDRVVEDLIRDTTGTRHWWNNMSYPGEHHCPNPGTGEGQCGLPADRFEAAQALAQARVDADTLYVRVMRGIDWQRVLSQAGTRHYQMQKTDEGHRTGPASLSDDVCGECIEHAVLSTERFQFGDDGADTDFEPRTVEDFL